MKYHFKQSLHLTNAQGKKGKDFLVGVHEVDPMFEGDRNFLKYVGCGWISEVSPALVNAMKSPLQRAQDLHDKLIEKKTIKPVPVEAPKSIVEEKVEEVVEACEPESDPVVEGKPEAPVSGSRDNEAAPAPKKGRGRPKKEIKEEK